MALNAFLRALKRHGCSTARLMRCTPAKARYGFEFLGYLIKRGYRKHYLPEGKIRSRARQGPLYAYPKAKSISRFMDQVRQRTNRTRPQTTEELIADLNPLLRGWGEYYKRAPVRRLFHRLDGWIVCRPPAGITGATIEIPGDDVLVKTKDTIIVAACNVYFAAKRVRNEPMPGESRQVPSNTKCCFYVYFARDARIRSIC
jgi:Group II intron, maturase-specific domain